METIRPERFGQTQLDVGVNAYTLYAFTTVIRLARNQNLSRSEESRVDRPGPAREARAQSILKEAAARQLSDHDGYRGCIVAQMPAGKSRDLVEQAAQHAVSIRRAMSNNRFQKAIVAELEAL